MASSPLILVALAKSALPSINFTQVRSLPANHPGLITAAVATDTNGHHYLIQEARNAAGNLELASSVQGARAVRNSANFSFEIPSLVGETVNQLGKTVQIQNFIFGNSVHFDSLRPTDEVLTSLAGTLGEIHSIPLDRIRSTGIPEYSAEQFRQAKLAELDRIAASGKIDSQLLTRWEAALEDLNLFRFQPTVVHGAIEEGNVLEVDNRISGIIGWSKLNISDPAIDFINFALGADSELLDSVRFGYYGSRAEADSNLAQRATLYAELSVANFLLASIEAGHEDDAEWATAELVALAESQAQGNLRHLSTNSFAQTTPVAEPDNHIVISEVSETVIEVEDLRTRPIEVAHESDSADDQLF